MRWAAYVFLLLPSLQSLWPARAASQTDAHEQLGTSAPQTQALGFGEALALLEQAPELRARAAAAQQLRAAERDVTSLPSDLAVSFELGPRVAPSPAAQGRASIAQSFALSELGSARRAVLDSRANVVAAERVELHVQRRLAVGQAWLRVHAAHAALQIAQAELTLAQALSIASQHALALRELTRADAADALAYAAEAQLAVLSTQGELIDARLDLTRTLSVSEHVLDVQGDPPALMPPEAAQLRALRARIEQQPALLLLLRNMGELAARQRALQAAHASQISLGLVLDRSDPKAWAMLGAVGFTWPLGDRAALERSELAAQHSVISGELAERKAALHVEIERLLHEIEHTHETLLYADSQLLPAIERGLQAREALFRSGEGTVLEIIVARRNALALRLRRLRLHGDWLSALLRFRELAGAVGITP